MLRKVFPIAGELREKGGGDMNAKWELLKNSKSVEDSAKEGLLLEINGGFKSGESGKKRDQKAIIEFLCDRERTGLENLPNPENPYEDVKDKRADDENPDDGTPSLEFRRYDTDGSDVDVLRLRWRTQYACEDGRPATQRWGFFTWFLIMYVFPCAVLFSKFQCCILTLSL